jgi:hypothetical protein
LVPRLSLSTPLRPFFALKLVNVTVDFHVD